MQIEFAFKQNPLPYMYINYYLIYLFIHFSYRFYLPIFPILVWSLIKRRTEWKRLIKHGMEMLSQHGLHPRTYGSRKYTPQTVCAAKTSLRQNQCLLKLSYLTV